MKKLLLMLAPLLLLTTSFAQAATHSVALSWTPSASACSSGMITNVSRVTTAGTEVIGNHIASIAAGTATYTDSAVVNGTTYFYKVSAYCNATLLESVFSNEVTAVIPNDAPVAPTGLTAIVK